jgi:hypothetical protein
MIRAGCLCRVDTRGGYCCTESSRCSRLWGQPKRLSAVYVLGRARSTNRYNRSRSLDALRDWGHDTTSLETAADIAARNQHVREGVRAGGCTDDPPC